MAKGYPDYFGQSIWPKFGTMLYASFDDNIAPGARETILDLTIQGQLHWGEIEFSSTSALGEKFYLTVDDLVEFPIDLDRFLYTGFNGASGIPIQCYYADFTSFIDRLLIAYPIPFHTAMKIEVENTAGAVLACTAYFGYYNVT